MSDTGTTPVPLQQLLTLYTYPDLARIGQAKVVSYAVRSRCTPSQTCLALTRQKLSALRCAHAADLPRPGSNWPGQGCQLCGALTLHTYPDLARIDQAKGVSCAVRSRCTPTQTCLALTRQELSAVRCAHAVHLPRPASH